MALLRTGRIPGSKTYSGGNPGQGEDELDRVADLSFRYDPVHEGKRIIGWDFVPVSNKPKEKRCRAGGEGAAKKNQQMPPMIPLNLNRSLRDWMRCG